MNLLHQMAPMIKDHIARIKDQTSLPVPRQLVVVVIDDQSACRSTFKRVLLSLDTDVEIETFSRPLEALEWCKQNQPALIITDFRMPEMDGVELVQRLRELKTTAHTPIIVSTITNDKALKVRALNAGATDFLMKPVDHVECRARCRNFLALSEYQIVLREHIGALNFQMNVEAKNTPDSDTDTSQNHAMPVSYVGVDYDDLFTLTSTVAAIDKLLEPLRATITDLEGCIQMPLAGQRARTY